VLPAAWPPSPDFELGGVERQDSAADKIRGVVETAFVDLDQQGHQAIAFDHSQRIERRWLATLMQPRGDFDV
jgi:hypothetical protein